MSLYAGSEINHRTAGYVPGVTVTPSERPASSSATSSSPSPHGRQSFDTLLQEAGSTSPSSPQRPASATAHQAAPSDSQPEQDPATADYQKPDNGRTAGRAVSHDSGKGASSSNEDGQSWSFFDMLDVINPLQHLPIVGSIYRAVTGDEIKSAARIMGGALFGGPVGAAFGVANAITSEATGGDISDNMMSFMRGEKRHENILQGPVPLTSSMATRTHTGDQKFADITNDQITWSQSQTTSPPNFPPRLNETSQTGPGADASSPSPQRTISAARENSIPTGFLPSHAPMHTTTHPTQGGAAEKRPPATHSLHKLPDGHNTGTATTMSDASTEGERNRKEVPNAGQENVGSPLFLSLQETPAGGEEIHSTSESVASNKDFSAKMMDGLNKYQAVMSQRYQN